MPRPIRKKRETPEVYQPETSSGDKRNLDVPPPAPPAVKRQSTSGDETKQNKLSETVARRVRREAGENLSGDYPGDYPGDYTGDYPEDYTGDYPEDKTGDYPEDYTGDYPEDYTGDYPEDFTGDYPGDYKGDYPGDYTGYYPGDHPGDYPEDYIGDYSGDYVTDYPDDEYDDDELMFVDIPDYMKDDFNFEDLGFSDIQNENDFYSFLVQSTTLDLSDLVDLLKPSVRDLHKFGYQPEEFIVSCSFDKKNCSHRDFTIRRNSYYGNCYTFNNIGKNQTVRTTSKFGSKYGLRLTLNIHASDYVGMFSHAVGAKVSIHPPTVEPFPEDDGISAAPGQETSIGAKMQEIYRQKNPYPSNCTDGDKMRLVVGGDYTVQACGVSCLQGNMYKECGCVDKILRNTSLPRCKLLNRTEEICRQKIRFLYDNSLLGCSCPVACHELVYNTIISTAQWPSKPFENLMKTQMMDRFEAEGVKTEFLKAKDLTSDLVRLHIYLENDEVMTIEEYPYYVLDQLVADIGGLLGLFIGLSICTAIEFLEFLFDLILICCASKRKVSP